MRLRGCERIPALMSKADQKLQNIPIVRSGSKYVTEAGFTAIKDGQKQGREKTPARRGDKPRWLRAPMPTGKGYSGTRNIVHQHRLSTVCEESKCPNIGECWNAGTATIMVLGSVCTRACRFCAVDTGNPKGWLDSDEPANTGRAVRLMGLEYVVITSVDRDDLPDGGAAHYAACVREIKKQSPMTAVEALTPETEQGVAELHLSVVVDERYRYAVRGLSVQPTLVRRFLERIDLRYDPMRPAPLETQLSMEDRVVLGEAGASELEFILLPKEER